MANQITVQVPSGYNLILTTDQFSRGRYYRAGRPGEKSNYEVFIINPSETKCVNSDVFQKSIVLESITGQIQYRLELDIEQLDTFCEDIIPNVSIVIPSVNDIVLVKDTSDGGKLKGVTLQSIIDLAVGGSISSAANSVTVDQLAHGFSTGDVVRLNGMGVYSLAQANTPENAEVIGIVSDVPTLDQFTLVTDGLVDGLSGLAISTTYFLDPFIPGKLTSVEPDPNLYVRKPLLVANDVTSGFFKNYVGEYLF